MRRPVDPERFHGTVVVEWLNVSAGFDSAPDWTYLADEITRSGHAWVGVSAQAVGVTGGASLVGLAGTDGLRGADPERYGSLTHPGDAFSYDLFTLVGRGLVDPGPVDPLGGLGPERLLAVGESQSAFRLSTYLNAIHPLEHVYDGFLVHSRGASVATLGGGTGLDLEGPAVRIRDDQTVPVIVVETETDLGPVLGYHAARQPDTGSVRTWEVAGTAHADAYQLGGHADFLGCTHLVNAGPQHFAVKAALRHLVGWARGGPPPPRGPRLTVVGGDGGVADPTLAVVRDGLGNALGGIRTPLVDVPLATLSGDPPGCGQPMCRLFGSTVALEPARVAARYPSRRAYLDAYERSADDAIAAGFVLAEDRAELLAAGAAAADGVLPA